jgi:hypothetical protein
MTLQRWLITAALFATAASSANADTIQYLSAPTGVNDGSYYVLPYQITIDGKSQLVACYDIFDEVNSGDTWQAQLLDLNQAAQSGYFSKTPGALADYERVAWLDAQPYDTSAEQIALQYAIWDVFGTYKTTTQSQAWAAAANAAAATGYRGFDFSGVRFVEQTGGTPGQNGTKQAFVYWATTPAGTDTPEPGSLLLLVPAGVFLAGFAFSRRFRPLEDDLRGQLHVKRLSRP